MGAHRMRRGASGGLVLAAAALAGCGGGTRSTSSTAAPTSTPTSRTSASSAPARPRGRARARAQGAPVGATQRVHAGSSTLAVTVTKVLDPLTDSGGRSLPGTRPVGVMVAIRHLAGATYDSTASGDWSLLTTGGAAPPFFVRHGVCQTPLVDFESLVGAGETRSGCVAFSAAQGAHLIGIRFSPHSRGAGAVRWRP